MDPITVVVGIAKTAFGLWRGKKSRDKRRRLQNANQELHLLRNADQARLQNANQEFHLLRNADRARHARHVKGLTVWGATMTVAAVTMTGAAIWLVWFR